MVGGSLRPDGASVGHAVVRVVACYVIATTLLWAPGCMLQPGSQPWDSVGGDTAMDSPAIATPHPMTVAVQEEAAFCTPTSGTLGYRYDEGTHKGIDIWTGTYPADAAAPGNPVYLAYGGVLKYIWEGRNERGNSAAGSDGVRQALVFIHDINAAYAADVPVLQVATVYMHMADEKTGKSFLNAALHEGTWYPAGTLLGYQGDRRYYRTGSTESDITHLHFDVRLPDLTTYLDPSPYLGLALNVKENPLPKGTKIVQACTGPVAAIRLTSPNGGEVWQVGSAQTLAWTSAGLNQNGSVYIFCSADGTWYRVAGPLSLSTSSHSWVVPDTPTTAGLVFVGNWVNNAWEASDWSDAAFSITSLTPVADFSVSTAPTEGSAFQGSSTSTTVHGLRTSGSTASVSFSILGLPGGVTATPSSWSWSLGDQSTPVSFAVGTSVPAGTYNITIRGTGGGVTRTATFALTVNAPPPSFDFSVSASPTAGTVTQGGSTSTDVHGWGTAGPATQVSFNITGLPTGVTASVSSWYWTLGDGVRVVTFSAASNAPVGTYTITVGGTGGGVTRTATLALTVNALPPSFDFSVSASPTAGTVTQGG